MLTSSQIKWDSQHDWFCESYDWFISAWDVSYDSRTRQSTRKLVYHYDFAVLREWAGY